MSPFANLVTWPNAVLVLLAIAAFYVGSLWWITSCRPLRRGRSTWEGWDDGSVEAVDDWLRDPGPCPGRPDGSPHVWAPSPAHWDWSGERQCEYCGKVRP